MNTFSNQNWPKLVMVVALESAAGYLIFGAFPVIAMLFLGEGGGSALYSSGVSILWMLSPFMVPAFFNLERYITWRQRDDYRNAKTYLYATGILFVFFIAFTLYWSTYHNYHI